MESSRGMPGVRENLDFWDRDYQWLRDGDEWDDQAEFCGVPYERWKRELAETFLYPEIHRGSRVLEIAPGHGRWTELIAERAGECIVADISAACIEHCKRRLARFTNVRYHLNDGRSLRFVESESIDVVWSFDSFVHIEEVETRSYFRELHRVMRAGARGCIHHPGLPSAEQKAAGWRSDLTTPLVAAIVRECGLELIGQTDSWGEGAACNTRLFADCLTLFARR